MCPGQDVLHTHLWYLFLEGKYGIIFVHYGSSFAPLLTLGIYTSAFLSHSPKHL